MYKAKTERAALTCAQSDEGHTQNEWHVRCLPSVHGKWFGLFIATLLDHFCLAFLRIIPDVAFRAEDQHRLLPTILRSKKGMEIVKPHLCCGCLYPPPPIQFRPRKNIARNFCQVDHGRNVKCVNRSRNKRKYLFWQTDTSLFCTVFSLRVIAGVFYVHLCFPLEDFRRETRVRNFATKFAMISIQFPLTNLRMQQQSLSNFTAQDF